jgi:hypothetical protein
MPPAPTVRLHLLDAFSEPIREEALVMFRNLTTGTVWSVRSAPGEPLVVTGLPGAPSGWYRMEADPAGYLGSGGFLQVAGSGETEATLWFAVDPSRVTAVTFPDYDELDPELRRLLEASPHVASFEGFAGFELYRRLDDMRGAGLLNIAAKCRVTPLTDGTVVLAHLRELRDLRGDRCFVVVPQSLRDEVKNAAVDGLFEAVNGALHHPPPGYTPAGSFKTRDHYGNLQLTFFAGPMDWVADVDIDDANGLAHAYQVLRNELTGRPTHPYDIHEILILYQQLDPGYRFEL